MTSGHGKPGEFEIIRRYFAPLATAAGAHGLANDAATLSPADGMDLVLTADAIVAGVHYIGDEDAADVAAKLLRSNLSDLAAMGARPVAYLLTCAFPHDVETDWIARFAQGLAADQAEFDLTLLGGDTVSTPGPASFSLTAIGEVAHGRALTRDGGRVGDGLYLSGCVGDGALGLEVARGRLRALDGADRDYLLDRFRRPRPRLALGRALVGRAGAALDVSDGLLADLGHLLAGTDLGAVIRRDRLPLSGPARRALEADDGLWARILGGGDDYELLFAAPADLDVAALAAAGEVAVTRIGELVTGGSITLIDDDGAQIEAAAAGYQHF